MILLFTDFGYDGPYLGQLEAVLYRAAPQHKVINLQSDAPSDPRLSGYLLAALRHSFPLDSIFVCVIDPGVGGERLPLILRADGQYFIGPDNGLLNTVAKQSKDVTWWCIDWRPEQLSSSFHGRDLFAPVAAKVANGVFGQCATRYPPGPGINNWPADINAIIYFDHFGNAITGMRYQDSMADKLLCMPKHPHLKQANTFCRVAPGEAFWYCNSSGLIEIAVNQGRANEKLLLSLGDTFQML